MLRKKENQSILNCSMLKNKSYISSTSRGFRLICIELLLSNPAPEHIVSKWYTFLFFPCTSQQLMEFSITSITCYTWSSTQWLVLQSHHLKCQTLEVEEGVIYFSFGGWSARNQMLFTMNGEMVSVDHFFLLPQLKGRINNEDPNTKNQVVSSCLPFQPTNGLTDIAATTNHTLTRFGLVWGILFV